jgi:two-component system nitrogen regulation response regulator NtrX
LREAREVFEREYLQAQVTRFGGNISKTAQFVGMERSALHRKLKSLNINSSDREDFKDENEPSADSKLLKRA